MSSIATQMNATKQNAPVARDPAPAASQQPPVREDERDRDRPHEQEGPDRPPHLQRPTVVGDEKLGARREERADQQDPGDGVARLAERDQQPDVRGRKGRERHERRHPLLLAAREVRLGAQHDTTSTHEVANASTQAGCATAFPSGTSFAFHGAFAIGASTEVTFQGSPDVLEGRSPCRGGIADPRCKRIGCKSLKSPLPTSSEGSTCNEHVHRDPRRRGRTGRPVRSRFPSSSRSWGSSLWVAIHPAAMTRRRRSCRSTTPTRTASSQRPSWSRLRRRCWRSSPPASRSRCGHCRREIAGSGRSS